MSDNQPDFERMSQDEIMAWMESLAKRQGATEGFTTSADMEIAEIDPDTAVIDEPGYVPYSEGRGSAPKAAPPPQPVARPVPTPPAAPPPPPEPAAAPAEISALAWLESLAANQNDSLFNLDLSALETPSPADEPEPVRTDPQAWLQGITRTQGELAAEGPQEGDTVEWLETLAVRQGAAADEIITPAAASVPRPDAEAEAPAYAPFSFETAASSRGVFAAEPGLTSNPADFLTSLSLESGYSESGVLATQPPPPTHEDSAVIEAISAGSVTSEQIQGFMERQMDRAMHTPEPEAPAEEEEAPPVRAEIPDWLIAQVGPPPASMPERNLPPLESILPAADEAQPPQQPDSIPDWLSPNALPAQPAIDMGELLQQDSMDEGDGDTWAEAFDLEYLEGPGDVDNPPEWYLRNIEDPQRNSRIASLTDVPLPLETDLTQGAPEALPAWMDTRVEEVPAPLPAQSDEDMPAWITAEATPELEPEPEPEAEPAPWWEQQPASVDASEALEAPAVVREFAAPPLIVPPPASAAAEPALDRARTYRRAGDLAACLAEYDALLRSGAALESVVDDLTELVSAHRDQPAAYRVLGDGYMRQGKLQRALDVYREALNLL